MRIEYMFDTDTTELLFTTEYQGHSIVRRRYKDELYVDRAAIFVVEGLEAEREFFNHFGDDSSWPDGWWVRLTTDKFAKLSWIAENYPLWTEANYTWPFGKTQS